MRYKTDDQHRGQPDVAAQRLAKALGVFSLVLGILELIFAGPLTRGLGLSGYDWIVPAYGVREILTGILILAFRDPTPWIWLRVAGDALDIATVAFGYSRHIADSHNFVWAGIALAGATFLDIYCAVKLSKDSKRPLEPTKNYEDRSGMPA